MVGQLFLLAEGFIHVGFICDQIFGQGGCVASAAAWHVRGVMSFQRDTLGARPECPFIIRLRKIRRGRGVFHCFQRGEYIVPVPMGICVRSLKPADEVAVVAVEAEKGCPHELDPGGVDRRCIRGRPWEKKRGEVRRRRELSEVGIGDE
jgi:hypothetical protein